MGYFSNLQIEVMERAEQLGDTYGERLEVLEQIAAEFDITPEEVQTILQGEYDGDSPDEEYDDSMDGDHESALASAGWGTDEDYGYYGDE